VCVARLEACDGALRTCGEKVVIRERERTFRTLSSVSNSTKVRLRLGSPIGRQLERSHESVRLQICRVDFQGGVERLFGVLHAPQGPVEVAQREVALHVL